MNIGERIKKRRLELGLSVDDIAEKLEKNRATIYRYESSAIESMPVSVLAPLAETLRTTPGYLMGWGEALECPHEAAQACEYYELCHASAVTAEAAGLFSRLDTLDQGRALGRMEDMLEGDKYKASGEGKKYKEFVSEDGEKILLSEKAM